MSASPRGWTVALVSSNKGWGGGEEQIRLLAIGLARRGHRSVVFARADGELARRLAAPQIEVIPMGGRGRSPVALWRLRRQLRRLRPDVLHHNDSHALATAGLASFGLPIPARIASRRVGFPLRRRFHYRLFADRVVCVSRAAAELCRACGLADHRLRVVYDGVDPARMAAGDRRRGRQTLGISDDEPLLLTVAKLTDCKGHAYLLEALPAVFARHPRAVAVLAGDGELLDALSARALRLGIDRRVRFLGYREDVPDLILAADLFVLPSHTEGLCSTLIDAMLAARPIVTTTAGGIPELVGPTADAEPVAWMAPPRDARALTEAILAALESPAKGAALGRRARERAERYFTADRMVEATLAVYREALGG